MLRAEIILDRDFEIGAVDRRLFGTFVEHLGRCVYGGIFEPGHPSADARGFRRDVIALVRELGTTIVRYPGGNFVSGYNWEDGVGPLAGRPVRLDLAWRSIEPNRFGTNEFIDWCRAAEVEPMLVVNLGTRGPDAARNLVEYCNFSGGTALSDLRNAHGHAPPHGVNLWCLGNEMDAPWQMGSKMAAEYGRIAAEAAKLMKWVDPSIELVACGSSNRNMPTFGAWEHEVLRHTLPHVEYIALHSYFGNRSGDTATFLASADLMDRYIKEVVAIADGVAAQLRSPRRIMICFDEWNILYRTDAAARRDKLDWSVAPALIEEVYNMEDALVVGGALVTLLNNADRVRVACLAQLVNVIAPIMAERGGPAWRQSIFHPFAQVARLAKGRALRAIVRSPCYATEEMPELAYLLVAAVHDPATRGLALFALNRSLREPLQIDVALRAFTKLSVINAVELCHDNLQAINSRERPSAVAPAPLSGVSLSNERLGATLKPASWNVIQLAPAQ